MERLTWRFIKWLVARIGLTTLASLTLLSIGLGAAASGLTTMVREVESQPIMLVAFTGGVLGWLLARSRWRAWSAALVSLIFCVFTSLISTAHAGKFLFALLQANLQTSWEFIRSLLMEQPWQSGMNPDLAVRWSALLAQALGTMLARVILWMRALAASMPAVDAVVVTLVWSLVLWGITIWAGWFTCRRNQPLTGMLPAVALLAYNLYYTDTPASTLATLVGATILLQVLHSGIAREQRWQKHRIDVTEIYLDLGATATMVTILLMVFALLSPSLSVKKVVEKVQDMLTVEEAPADTIAESLGLEARPRPTSPFQGARASGLPTQRLLGSGAELSKNQVMRVTLDGYLPFNPALTYLPWIQIPPAYYYRSLVYDRYNGRGWATSPTNEQAYPSGEMVNTANSLQVSGAFRYVNQQIQEMQPLNFLYQAGELVTSNQEFTIAWRSDGDALGAQIDASTYRVTSRMPVVSAAQLRAAGSDYPEWVRQRYLYLPEELPLRVRSLALDLTVSQPTPYDRALAIETSLRTYPYTLDLPTPPIGEDVVDYFLFELQRGYCDYFSSAMVVLARAAGLPARVVSGFASGSYDPSNAWFNISEADAHAWVEIFFPGYGWIEFEPTSSRPPINRPEDIPVFSTPNLPANLTPTRLPGAPLFPINLPIVLIPMAFITAILYLWWQIDLFRLRQLAPERSLSILYHRLARLGAAVSIPLMASDTPAEYGQRLLQHLDSLAHNKTRKAALSWISLQVDTITRLHAQAIYSSHPPGKKAKNQLIEDWPGLLTRLWLARLWRRPNARPPGML